jgi:two-component system NtrC family sensor kinase
MARTPRLGALFASLSFRLLLVLGPAILLLFVLHIVIAQHLQTVALEHGVRSSAYPASDFIRQSLYTSMLRNERDRIHAMITLLGSEPGVEVIRLYNKQGRIAYSSVEREIGASVDLRAEACTICHAAAQPLRAVPTDERARIYRRPGSHRVLGLINPIRNEPGCTEASCHAHAADVTVLGVLDVQMSLESLDAAAAAARRRALAPSVAVVVVTLGLMAVIVYRAVHRPVLALRRGTEQLARGDLTVEIGLRRRDELGLLAASFNQMARSLREADAELRDWSHTLEERVQEKTLELERLNAHLVQVEKAASLGLMAATVAHELNNPLSGILAQAGLIQRRVIRLVPEGEDRDRLVEGLRLIQSEAARCGNIVRDLLTYARQGSAAFRPARLHDLVDRALQLVAHHTELRGIATDRELTLADDALVCEPEQLVQALVALCVNAVEAMGEGGRLTVRSWAEPSEPDAMRLAVVDTGVGIAPEVLPHIFDPFYSTKDESKGVGLGLAVVYGIVQRHAGRIDVASRPGRGTTFTIVLPRRGPAPVAAGAGAERGETRQA